MKVAVPNLLKTIIEHKSYPMTVDDTVYMLMRKYAELQNQIDKLEADKQDPEKYHPYRDVDNDFQKHILIDSQTDICDCLTYLAQNKNVFH